MNKALGILGYSTILRLFELENYEINEMVYNGVCHIIQNHLNLRRLSSQKNPFQLCDITHDLTIEISKTIEKTSDIIDYQNLNDEFIKLKLLSKEINVYSSNVIYIKMNKKLLN